ncbi:hypothetical protein GmRootV15_68860 (plasmid) [Variovorax sp. V15]
MNVTPNAAGELVGFCIPTLLAWGVPLAELDERIAKLADAINAHGMFRPGGHAAPCALDEQP